MNDYSEYLNKPGMLAWIEQEWKRNPHIHDEHARIVNEFIREYKIISLTELGCSTGNLASRIDVKFYKGIDSNEDSVTLAKTKCPEKEFIQANIRDFKGYDMLVICFAVLKHFGLHEWTNIFNTCSEVGRYFIFDMPIGEQTRDDGTEFHPCMEIAARLITEH